MIKKDKWDHTNRKKLVQIESTWEPSFPTCIFHFFSHFSPFSFDFLFGGYVSENGFFHTTTYKLSQLTHSNVCVENSTNSQSHQLGIYTNAGAALQLLNTPRSDG